MSYVFRKKHKKIDIAHRDEIYEEERPHAQFKVTNKTTLKILQEKGVKPIHHRVEEIVTKRNKHIKLQQLENDEKEKESMKPLHRSIDCLLERKYN
jgi:hypothetical protein